MGLVGATDAVARGFVASAVFIGGRCWVVANVAADIARRGTGRRHPRRMSRAFCSWGTGVRDTAVDLVLGQPLSTLAVP
jgi:hypothetical protein